MNIILTKPFHTTTIIRIESEECLHSTSEQERNIEDAFRSFPSDLQTSSADNGMHFIFASHPTSHYRVFNNAFRERLKMHRACTSEKLRNLVCDFALRFVFAIKTIIDLFHV